MTSSSDKAKSRNREFQVFWAVWTKPCSGDKGSWRPIRKTYDTPLAAAEVALASARAKPGQKFFVVQAVGRFMTHEGGIDAALLDGLGIGLLTPDEV